MGMFIVARNLVMGTAGACSLMRAVTGGRGGSSWARDGNKALPKNKRRPSKIQTGHGRFEASG